MAGKCNHEESRLTCTECGSAICSQCLVQCPVGFRCRACAGSVKNPLADVTPKAAVKTFFLCGLVGFGGGWITPFINVPFIGFIICYFLGLFAGRWLKTVIDYRLGPKLGVTVLFGVLVGMSLTTYALWPALFVQLIAGSFTGQGPLIFDTLTSLVGALFSPVLFIVGVLTPTVWGERW